MRTGVHTNQPRIWTAYKQAWTILLANFKVIGVIYAVNLLIAFIALGPLSNVFKKAIEKTAYHEGFSKGFDYTLLMDILNNYGVGINVSFSLLTSMAIPAFLWAVFCSGGIAEIISHYPSNKSLSTFWKGGGKYFFRYFRLGLYFIGLLGAAVFLMLTLFFPDGLNVLAMETENAAINKVYLLLILLSLFCFFLSIFKELAKSKITQHHSFIITLSNRLAFLQTFRVRNFLMGLINFLVLLLVFSLYYLLRKLSGGYLIPIVLLGQLFLLFRIAHRFVKQASFCIGDEAIQLTPETFQISDPLLK